MKLIKDDFGTDGTTYWTLIDRRGKTVWEFQDYVLHCVDQLGLRAGTVAARAYAIAKWYRFLAASSKSAFEPSDEALKAFRGREMEQQSSNSHGSEKARMRSVNQTLRCIYLYYGWLQSHAEYGKDRSLLGAHNSRITSSLLEPRRPAERNKYPLLFRRAGEHSKHRLGFVPSEADRARLVEYFYKRYDPHIACRNALIMEIAWRAGWRRGSILSLQIGDFVAPEVREDEGVAYICPKEQKFGHQFYFRVDLSLVSQILEFVSRHRSFAKGTANGSGHIFVSYTSGKPLRPQYVSSLFSKARRELGLPLGAGLHSWRRGFIGTYLEREIDARLELGLDTSSESIEASIAHALGHESTQSQSAYIRDSQRRLRLAAAGKSHRHIQALENEISTLRARLECLETRKRSK